MKTEKNKKRKQKKESKGHNWADPSRPTEAQPVVFLLFSFTSRNLGLRSWL
jgi:hypothetical protein